MANLLARLRRSDNQHTQRFLPVNPAVSFSYNGLGYSLGGIEGSSPDVIAQHFRGYVEAVHRRYGVVAGAAVARSLLMSQIRPKWRSEATSRLFGNRELRVIERPDPGHLTRPRMFSQIDLHHTYAGNAYVWRRPEDGRLQLLDPGDVSIVYVPTDDMPAEDAPRWGTRLGYVWFPYGREHGFARPLALREVAHIPSGEPAPDHRYLGESWVTGVLREIVVDGQSTDHISKFLQNAASPSIIIRPDKAITPDQRSDLQEVVQEKWGGAVNAGRPLVVGGGSDVTVVGSKLGEMALQELQGGFENRVAVRSRVPAVILGTREGQQGSSLNAGNYSQIRRHWAETWFLPHAEDVLASLEWILTAPPNAELSFDPDRVLFLQEDRKDEADIFAAKMAGIRQGVDGGFDPDAVVAAAVTGRLEELTGGHTGLLSVQLMPPGEGEQPATDDT